MRHDIDYWHTKIVMN